MKWSGVGTTVFAVPKGFVTEPGVYCGGSGDGDYDGHDTIDIVEWNTVVNCPAGNMRKPALPQTDDIVMGIDPTFRGPGPVYVHAHAYLPRAVAGFGAQELSASRRTLPAGWEAVPAGVPTDAPEPRRTRSARRRWRPRSPP